MSMVNKALIQDYAAAVAEAVAKRVVTALMEITDTLSEDESGLGNAWDEICVQVQGEESFFWDTYREVICSVTQGELNNLPYRDLAALWLQTDDGWNWQSDVEYEEQQVTKSEKSLDTQRVPYVLDAITEYILQEHLLPIAQEYTNENVAAYLRGESTEDDDRDNEEEELRERLIALMPRDSMVMDLWDWDIHFENESFADIVDPAFLDDEGLAQHAEALADDFLRWIDEFGMAYNQQGWSSPDEFADWIGHQCLDFMKRWRDNAKKALGQ